MSDKHTPAPWATETVKVEPDLGERMLIKQVNGKKGDSYIADTFCGMEKGGSRSKEECEANAALIVEAVNTFAERQWVSVKDRLPDRDDRFFVVAPSADPLMPIITVAWYHPKSQSWSLSPFTPSHWMEVPKPPA